MTSREMQTILDEHRKWMNGKAGGQRADLHEAGLYRADLREANLFRANLYGAELDEANLYGANLRGANLYGANLYEANLRNADLKLTDLTDADLNDADLRRTDLSGAKGLVSPIDFMQKTFERCMEGYIVYKVFGVTYFLPSYWTIEPGAVIEEVVNANRTDEFGCGIHVAPLERIRRRYPNQPVYKLLIRWEWLPGVVVPYNTDGAIRCERAQIIEQVQ